jgi:hypothetical protein
VNILLFNLFPYIFISALFFYAFMANGKDLSGLISVVYLFFGLSYILNFRNFYEKNVVQLKALRIWNFIVLAAVLIFQLPLFECPAFFNESKTNKGELYITNEQCVMLQDSSDKDANIEEGFNSAFSFYVVLMRSLGIQKIYRDA